jgi:hypothetical protein
MIPQLVVWQRPNLVTSRWLVGIFDAAIGLFGLVLAVGIHIYRASLPVWLLALGTGAGIIIVIVAVSSLRRGGSFFSASLNFLEPNTITQQIVTLDFWRKWLNVRLPDPLEQRALKKAMDEMYRPSLLQTAWKYLIIGVGGWIIINAIEAIIELYVQEWWKKYFWE